MDLKEIAKFLEEEKARRNALNKNKKGKSLKNWEKNKHYQNRYF